jgi:hypothetical protein
MGTEICSLSGTATKITADFVCNEGVKRRIAAPKK